LLAFFLLKFFKGKKDSWEKNVSLGPYFIGEKVLNWKVFVSVFF